VEKGVDISEMEHKYLKNLLRLWGIKNEMRGAPGFAWRYGFAKFSFGSGK